MLTDRQTGELTGYPSIDKPWLKYYSGEAINALLPECTIFEYLWTWQLLPEKTLLQLQISLQRILLRLVPNHGSYSHIFIINNYPNHFK